MSTIVNSETQKVGSWNLFRNQLHYAYVSTYDSSTVSESDKAKAIILFVVGTGMSADAYTDIAGKCVAGQSTVFVTVDNNPGALVKLSGDQAAAAFNDLAAKTTERLGDIVSSDAKIFIGGHSAGGFSAIAAMKVNGGKLDYEPAGFIGADPLGRRPQVSDLKIDCPTFAMGFTVETCSVTLKEAGFAAYDVTTDGNRVLMQIVNLRNRGNQITHCIFASDGCPACPAHEAGAWVRQVIGDFAILFVDSVVNGNTVAKSSYVNATGDKKDLVNVFYGDETATV